MTVEQPYFIASTTKLFTTALILQLRSAGRLGLDDLISKYVNPALLSGLRTFRGKDYTPEITIKHLLAHTTGLPDYFQGKAKNGNCMEKETTAGHDQVWSIASHIMTIFVIHLAKTTSLNRNHNANEEITYHPFGHWSARGNAHHYSM
jgi:D-alanyl-D-alanine carboxypeptidase